MDDYHFRFPGREFYLCRSCLSHIARLDNLVIGVIYLTEEHVLIDGPEHHRIERGVTVANVRCNRCSAIVGLKFIEEQNNYEPVITGRFKMHLNKLLWYEGRVLYTFPNTLQMDRLATGRYA